MAEDKSISIEEVMRRRYLLSQSQQSIIWAAINAFFALLITIDLKCSLIGAIFDSNLSQTLILIFEVVIICILCLNCIYDIGLYVWQNYMMRPIELTSTQIKAFGVKPNELGFKECNPVIAEDKNNTWLKGMPPTPPFEISLVSDFDKHSSLNSTALSNLSNLSKANTSALSDGLSPGNCSLNSTSTSWVYEGVSNSFLPISPPLSSDEPITTSTSGLLRLRKGKSKGSDHSITNERDLENYLRNFEEREERFEEIVQSEKRQQQNNSNTAWNFSQTQLTANVDETQNKTSYQFAIDSPSLLNTVEFEGLNSSPSSASSKAMEAVLTKLKIDETVMNQWIENIRKWISLTILSRLVEEIDKINEMLVKMGYMDSIIGEAGLPAIKQIASLKKSQLSTLESVLPFLEIHSNQKYLVKRIRDLAKGGCIGQFNWNSGGSYDSKPWNEELLTDSAIIMHLLCTYMDLRLPSNPNSPEGKSFTNLYLKSISGQVPKSGIYITQVKVNPPHYKVYTKEDDVWELPIGRNNLFHAILVFLHCVKDKQFGHLGRINLGASGINILWVVQN